MGSSEVDERAERNWHDVLAQTALSTRTPRLTQTAGIGVSSDTLETEQTEMSTAVERYRRTMAFQLVGHGRAGCRADYGGADVAYSVQGVMGETLGGLTMGREALSPQMFELLRELTVQTLQEHVTTLRAPAMEMYQECGPVGKKPTGSHVSRRDSADLTSTAQAKVEQSQAEAGRCSACGPWASTRKVGEGGGFRSPPFSFRR